VDFLMPEDFGVEKHRLIFSIIIELATQPTIDAVTDRLMELGKLDSVGGLAGLVDLDSKAIGGVRLKGFGRSLRRKAIDRRAQKLQQKLGKALELGFSANSTEVRSVNDEIRALQQDLEIEIPARTFGQCLDEVGGLDALCSPARNLVPIAWENRLLTGFHGGQLIVGAGRTSAGKTVFGAQQAAHAAKLGHRTLFVSLEMSTPEMLKRFLAMISRVRHADLQSGTLNRTQREMVAEAAYSLSTWPLEITTDRRTVDSIRMKVREERGRGNPYRLVVVDYLQLLGAGEKFENRTQEVSVISRGLKLIAMENECVVLALSQLSRASESRTGDHEPRLSDLRDSGSIEQDADVVIFVHRPELYKPNDASLRNVAKLIVGKNRNGAIGAFNLVWIPQHVTFSEPGQPQEVA
jgi:replicative DNA helicase